MFQRPKQINRVILILIWKIVLIIKFSMIRFKLEIVLNGSLMIKLIIQGKEILKLSKKLLFLTNLIIIIKLISQTPQILKRLALNIDHRNNRSCEDKKLRKIFTGAWLKKIRIQLIYLKKLSTHNLTKTVRFKELSSNKWKVSI